MKKIFVLFIGLMMLQAGMAQPKQSRKQQNAKQTTAAKQTAVGLTTRAQISFPTEAAMPEDVVWKREIYREIDLNEDANGGLYYPAEPIGKDMNLFTYIFKLALGGVLPIYEYDINGSESFADNKKLNMKDFLQNYSIFYEEENGKIKVENSDIPSSEVKSYYIKESSYFDQSSSVFRTQVLALCPIMLREDDFGDASTKYPLFWVKYDDLAPYLSRQNVMTSNLNNAATMSLDDYFTLNKYKGKIYKTNNMQGKTLAQYCPDSTSLSKEQLRIENELRQFEKTVWGDQAKKDSLDSIARAQAPLTKAAKKAAKNNAKSNAQKSSATVKESKPKASKSKSSSGSGSAARVSVRRQRH